MILIRFVLPQHLANWISLFQPPRTHFPLDSRSHTGSSVASLGAEFHISHSLLVLERALARVRLTSQKGGWVDPLPLLQQVLGQRGI